MSDFSRLNGAHVGPSTDYLSSHSDESTKSNPPEYSPRTIPSNEYPGIDESTALLGESSSSNGQSRNQQGYKLLQYAPRSLSVPSLPQNVKPIFSKVGKGAKNVFFKKTLWLLLALVLILIAVFQALQVNWPQEFLNATIVDIQKVEFDQFTDQGVNLRVQGNIRINYSMIDNGSYRSRFLRIGAYPLHTISLYNTTSALSFKQDGRDSTEGKKSPYEHAVTAHLPPMDVNIRHNETTEFDLITNLTDFGSPSLLASIVKRVLAEQEIEFKYDTSLPVHKGFIPLGTWPFSILGTVNPSTPDLGTITDNFNLDGLEINPVPKGSQGVSIAAMISAFYNFSISADLPELRWKLFIPGCDTGSSTGDNEIYVADISNMPIHLKPFAVNELEVHTHIKTLSSDLNQQCPGSNHSALDQFAQQYLSGSVAHIKIQGSWNQPAGVPWWIKPILPMIEIKIPIRGQRTDQKLIRELEMSNFKMTYPPRKTPFEKPSGLPKLSAHIQATIVPPPMLNMTEALHLSVKQARGIAELFSGKGEQFAIVYIPEWLPCITTTKMVDRDEDESALFKPSKEEPPKTPSQTLAYVVDFNLNGVPMNVTDESVFSEVARQMIVSGSAPITLHARVDADLSTPLGSFIFSDIPIEGDTVIRA